MHPNNAQLQQIMMQNDIVTYALSRYLNLTPRNLSAEFVTDFAKDCALDTEESFFLLFCAACGLDPSQNPLHKELQQKYFRPGTHRLDPQVYQNDLYYRTVKLPKAKQGKWELCEHFYAPFEPFVCNHPIVTPDFREIPQIGYFTTEFRFPAVLENGVEWMTVTPNEIETMRQPIMNSFGRVLTLGLGLGYFAFCASEKEEVESVTIVEWNQDVIDLFEEHILPQFPHAKKISIRHADAFEFLKQSDLKNKYDYLFADLWHDQSDGIPMYLRLKRMQKKQGFPKTDYWIEPTLLSSLRHSVYTILTDQDAPAKLKKGIHADFLSDDYLSGLAADMQAILK